MRLWLLAALAVTVVGCASVDQAQMRHLPERVELNGVPFFRGNA
ncbi:peptidase C39 family protein, partial [Pseudomonas sp. FSL R10-0071]|nr:peptidase C39 family protein [Pseudomonas sp. FSL R10-0071]